MKTATPVAPTILPFFIRKIATAIFACFFYYAANAQAVTEIITDYNGFWKSASLSVNPVKPDKAHNLLSFTYNGTRYSTGADDNKLSGNGVSFLQADFWSLPVAGMTGSINSNTKIGLGALHDGVYNGPGNPAPEWGIATYLTDGIKGLGLGTCIANLPVGSMSFSIENIRPAAIGDGIPDILVTQVADPSGSSFDRYEFTNASGLRVGTYKDIVFTNISPVGTWTADFYEAVNNPPTLQSGFTQTDRPIRLWAADISELGITTSNYQQIKNFKINLCGNSDVAFVAYNNKSIDFSTVLPAQYDYFQAHLSASTVSLSWRTSSEQGTERFVIERSNDGLNFTAMDSMKAAKLFSGANHYNYLDKAPLKGLNYYRLREIDAKGNRHFSVIVKAFSQGLKKASISVYPNPAADHIVVAHPAGTGKEKLIVYNVLGDVLIQQPIAHAAGKTTISVSHLAPGNYFAVYNADGQLLKAPFVIQ
ncbi:MAG: T9SS type A sorting domain-containing protein [Chitinophagaceae bacterium]|nr:MAG: T9SS type A sorting domain-containing protein [Chitinophagaceae bacterium]